MPYVWSPISTADKDGSMKVIPVGSSVKPDDVGGKEAYKELKEVGSIRDEKYPDTNPYESPREHNLRRLNEAIAEAEENAYSNINFNISAPEEPALEPGNA